MTRDAGLHESFEAHLAGLPLPSRHLLVAVSGGPDSVALLDLMAGCRERLDLRLTVGHVDHGIHPESAAVATSVERLAREYGLPSLVRVLALGSGASETTARAARGVALEALRVEAGAGAIVTAHHADDQAETVLMRILGGSGPAGLAAMGDIAGVLVRPLLPFRREELARHLQAIGAAAWQDPANCDLRHERAWIRHEVLPLLRARHPDIESRLLRVSTEAAADRAAWAAVLDSWPGLDLREDPDAISVAAGPLAQSDPALAIGIIRALSRRWGRPLGRFRAERVLELARGGSSGNRVPLGGDGMAELAFGRLCLLVAQRPSSERWELSGPSGERLSGKWLFRWSPGAAPPVQGRAARTAWFAPGALTVRSWRAGDRLTPLGGRGRRLLVRCFQDARVPRSLRPTWPVVEHAGQVAWVPGVCRSDLLVPAPGVEAIRVDAEFA